MRHAIRAQVAGYLAHKRSTAELLSIEADLSKRGIGLLILSKGGERLDTRNPTSKLMLTILAGVATWEREIVLERQREGIAKAKAAGKYKGRPVSIDAAPIKQLRPSWVLLRSPSVSASPGVRSTARSDRCVKAALTPAHLQNLAERSEGL
jgi:DNA invertase Pin-like site-specific DNA recombinase